MILFYIFQGLFKNIVLDLYIAIVTKKLWGILDFFHADQTFFRPVPYPINEKKYLTKNPLNYYSLNVKAFHGVKNESARTKKLQRA